MLILITKMRESRVFSPAAAQLSKTTRQLGFAGPPYAVLSPRQLFLNASSKSQRLQLFPKKSLKLRAAVPTQLTLKCPARLGVQILKHIVKMGRSLVRVHGHP